MAMISTELTLIKGICSDGLFQMLKFPLERVDHSTNVCFTHNLAIFRVVVVEHITDLSRKYIELHVALHPSIGWPFVCVYELLTTLKHEVWVANKIMFPIHLGNATNQIRTCNREK
jgi:hypothetical protein